MNSIGMFKEYEEEARKTDLIDELEGLSPRWVYYVLGLNGEVGELTEKVKKIFRDGDPHYMTVKDHDNFVKEAGDVLWYLTRLMNYLGITMQEVAETNVAKLQARLTGNKIHGDGDDR